ncbi:MAG: elongation factor P 5-aminopentanone reductase [Sarcina sp.]
MAFSGKVVIVTGGSKGIGKEIAIEFAKQGANIVINYSNDDREANETLMKVQSFGVSAVLIKANIGKADECKKIISETIKNFGKVDFLINNAGISKCGLFMDILDNEIEEILDINLKSVINLSRFAIGELCKTSGCIVNVSSIWGNIGASCEVLYSTTKGAINLFTKALAKEMAMSNVRVNAVAPGVIDTNMNSWMSDDEKKELIEEIPMNRFGDAKEVANAVIFLCSKQASYITGQILTIDGGML